jgi:hypothetical protein
MAAITADGRQELVALFLTMFGRAPTTVELAEAVVARENGSTLAQVATTLSAKTEFALIASKDADSFVTYLANALLAADTPVAARNYATNWALTQLQGTMTKAQLIAKAIQELRATTNVNYATAQAELKADVTASLLVIDNPVTPAQNVSLTTAIDTLTGTANNDNFNASINTADATKNTLNSADNINGGTGGTDSLTISASGTGGATLSGVTLTGVENLSITNGATALLTFDGSLSTGVTGVAVNGSTSAVTVSNLKAIPTVTLNGNGSDVTVGLQAAAVVGLADSANITLNASNTATSGTLTIDGVETLNVDVTGATGSATTTLTLADSSLQTLNITGTGGSWLAATLSGATGTTTGTVTSAGGADNVTITAGGSAKLNVSMGAGNDGVSLGTIAATYTVDGGDGTDTLTYSGSTAVTSTLAANIKGFEAVKLTGGASFNMATSAVTYTTAAAGTYTGLTAATAGATVNMEAGGTVTLANTATAAEYTGTADAVTINVGKSTTSGSLTSTVTTTGVETVTINNLNLGTDITGPRTNSITDAKLKTLNVTGAQPTTVTGGGAALTKFDATGASGGVTFTATVATAGAALTGGAGNDALTGGTGVDTIVGGSGNDTITGGAGADALTGGDGSDVFVVAANTTLVANSTAGAPKVVSDFVSGTDKLQLAQTPVMFLGNFTNIQQALAAQNGGTANSAAYVTGENSLYVFTNTDGTLNVLDSVVKLTGVATLTAADLQIGSQGATGGAAITLSAASAVVGTSGSLTNAAANSGTTVSNTTGVDDTISSTIAFLQNSTLTGGAGSDTITITGTTGGTRSSAELANITGFEVITLNNATGAISFTTNDANVATGSTLTINGASNAGVDANGALLTTAITVDASAETNGRLSVTGGAGHDSLTGGAGNDSLTGGAGNDSLTGNGGNDVIAGGDGNDTIVGNAAGATGGNTLNGEAGDDSVTSAAATDSVDGGAGNDQVTVGALTYTGTLAGGAGSVDRLIVAGATNFAGATLSGFEQLDFGGGNHALTMTRDQHASFTSAVGIGAASTQQITLTTTGAITGMAEDAGDDMTYVLANGSGNAFTAATTATDYKVTGGDTATTYAFGATLTAADTITGTAGSDTLTVTGAATGSANITAIETINVNYSTAATFTTGAIAGTATGAINLSGSTAAVTLDATAFVVGATSLTITDGAGNDAISIPNTDANRAKTTVTLSTGGADTITIANGAFNGTTTNAVTINNFTQAVGTSQDKIAGLGITTYQTVTTTGNVAAANAVVEIETGAGVVSTFDAGDAGVVEAAIDTALGTYGGADGTSFYAVVYGTGANFGKAALYQVNVTTAATGITAANIAVELVGTFNSITNDAFVTSNFL